MIIIYKDFVIKYINYLTPEHVKKYALTKNIYLTNEENEIIYNFIMNNYSDLLDNKDALLKLKPFIREELFEKVVDEYIKNKTKYL